MIYFDKQHNAYTDESQVVGEVVFTCPDEVWADFNSHTDKYVWIDDEFVVRPDWEEYTARKEAERIARLHLTRGDVFRGLLQAKGVTRAQIRTLIEAMPDGTQEQALAKEMALIDFDEALDFYRGVALIDTVGAQLGITSAQMTAFFETCDYHELVNDELPDLSQDNIEESEEI